MSREKYRVWRINPEKRVIAPLLLDGRTKNFAIDIQRMCRAGVLGHRQLCEVDGTPLVLAADAQADEGQPGFRFRGIEGVTAGLGVLFGKGDKGGLVAAPVDRGWLDRHLVWTDADETDGDGDAAE